MNANEWLPLSPCPPHGVTAGLSRHEFNFRDVKLILYTSSTLIKLHEKHLTLNYNNVHTKHIKHVLFLYKNRKSTFGLALVYNSNTLGHTGIVDLSV